MTPALPSGAVSVALGGALVVVGYLIAARGWTFLIAGFDRTSAADPDAVGDVVGNAVIRVGLAVAVVGGATGAGYVPDEANFALAAAILLVVARLLYRVNVVLPRQRAEGNGA
ncbi:DUF3784 domain-containing protein [Halosimplex pelagicum]|uniref:DUF3784 domain-containing protein n=1 Tax=Halosimplex pelagicum TaxID=869886 RepID=A0A7D5P411_9EURY|nr:DUF3784 domain-containing protein [Halosimplex pelagicum]QLH80366.1 DUF3784 domain-containing protein [Halosimplex pelagicum]